ncbi:MAG: CCC motif membrane protein [Bacteroidota bacterium]
MEKQKLPNVTTGLVLGIISFVCCCFSSGLGGVLMSGIAWFLLRKDEKRYMESPEDYDNYSQLKTAKIIAIIGLVLGVCTLFWTIFQIYQLGGIDGYMEKVNEAMELYGVEQ